MKIGGLPVVDAKKSLHITITPADIKKGNPKDPGACAAAQACIRQVDHCVEARVHLARTYLKMENASTGRQWWVRHYTPVSLAREAVVHDRDGKFEPGNYHLPPVQGTARFGVKRKRYEKSNGHRKGGKQGRRSIPHITGNVRSHGANK